MSQPIWKQMKTLKCTVMIIILNFITTLEYFAIYSVSVMYVLFQYNTNPLAEVHGSVNIHTSTIADLTLKMSLSSSSEDNIYTCNDKMHQTNKEQ